MTEKLVNILGTDYKISIENEEDFKPFKLLEADGICDPYEKIIHIRETDQRTQQKLTIRHELIHAFLHESGLDSESHSADSWSVDEEIIDWIALQLPKIYRVYEELEVV